MVLLILFEKISKCRKLTGNWEIDGKFWCFVFEFCLASTWRFLSKLQILTFCSRTVLKSVVGDHLASPKLITTHRIHNFFPGLGAIWRGIQLLEAFWLCRPTWQDLKHSVHGLMLDFYKWWGFWPQIGQLSQNSHFLGLGAISAGRSIKTYRSGVEPNLIYDLDIQILLLFFEQKLVVVFENF